MEGASTTDSKWLWRLYFRQSVCQSDAFVGVGDLSKLVYAAKKIYDSHRDDLERERTDEEFMAMYEQYEAFDELEDEFLEKEEEYTALVAGCVDEHLELFAKIVIVRVTRKVILAYTHSCLSVLERCSI